MKVFPQEVAILGNRASFQISRPSTNALSADRNAKPQFDMFEAAFIRWSQHFNNKEKVSKFKLKTPENEEKQVQCHWCECGIYVRRSRDCLASFWTCLSLLASVMSTLLLLLDDIFVERSSNFPKFSREIAENLIELCDAHSESMQLTKKYC